MKKKIKIVDLMNKKDVLENVQVRLSATLIAAVDKELEKEGQKRRDVIEAGLKLYLLERGKNFD